MGQNLFKEGKRRCRICKKILELSSTNFPTHRSASTGFHYECKNCGRYNDVRRKLIELVNFTCQHCGLKKQGNYSFFDIDHKEPYKRIRSKVARSRYYRKSETSNLQVLCPNCHRLKTISNKDNSN